MRGGVIVVWSVFCACGDFEDLIEGRGLRVAQNESRRRLVTDPQVVPLIIGCRPDALVVGDSSGTFDCAKLDPRKLSDEKSAELDRRVDPLDERLIRLQADIETTSAAVRLLKGTLAAQKVMLEDLTRRRAEGPEAVSALGCVPSERSYSERSVLFNDGKVASRNGGAVELRCPILVARSGRDWNAVEVAYRDADGRAAGSAVELEVLGLDRDGQSIEQGYFRSHEHLETNYSAKLAALTSGVAQNYTLTYSRLYSSELIGVRALRRRSIEPPELATPGGKVFVDGGGFGETIDSIGRFWQRDELFLHPAHQATRREMFNGGGPVALDLLTDRDIPQDVIRDERWCGCDLEYQMKVPNGTYYVQVYFSENCIGCTIRDFGGNQPPGNLHSMDVIVEDQTVLAYDQADAAIPPQGDGQGAVFRATELGFEVSVTDGLLDVTIGDRDGVGAGVPPGDSTMKAFTVERTR